MTFLSMTPVQAALLLGLTALAITIIFFLRIQHRQVIVASSLLWQRVIERQKKRSWIELLRRLISLLIALAIGLSLAASLADTEWGTPEDGPRDIALILDTSLTMAARGPDGTSRWEAAVDRASEILRSGSGADTFLVADTAGRVVAASSRDRGRALAALERLSPVGGRARVPELDPELEVVLITDGVTPYELPPDSRTISVFESADNVGITAFEIRPVPTDAFSHHAFLEVGNFSESAAEVQIVLEDGQRVQFRRTIELRPREYYRNTFDLSPLDGGALRARVSAETDQMPLDDEAWVWIPRQRVMRVLMVGGRGSALAEALASESHVELTQVDADGYAAAAAGTDGRAWDAMVLDGFAPADPPRVPTLIIAPPAVDWLPRHTGTVREPEGTAVVGDHPLLRFVGLDDLEVQRAARVEAGSSDVLVGADSAPLVLADDSPVPWILLTFALEESDFPQRLGFPIFVANLLEWFRPEAPFVRRAPGTVQVPLPEAVVTTLDAEPVPSRTIAQRTIFEAPAPGLFLARSGHRTLPVVVSLTDRDVSAVNSTRLTATDDAGEPLLRAQALRSTLLLLACSLLLLEGISYHRRVTV